MRPNMTPCLKKSWKSPIGIIETPNAFIDKANQVILWSKLGFDIDKKKSIIRLPYADTEFNECSGHQHVFINVKPVPSFKGLKYLKNFKEKKIAKLLGYQFINSSYRHSISYDFNMKYAHRILSELLEADKATSASINHGYRMSKHSYKDKQYKLIHKGVLKTTPYKLIRETGLYDRQWMRSFLVHLLSESRDGKIIPIIKSYGKYNKVKQISLKYDLIEMCKFITKHYWIKNHRQKLAMLMTGLLYKYISNDEAVLEDIFKAIIPKDDEEYEKRFHPIKYVSQQTQIPGLRKLTSYIRSNIDPEFDPKQFRINSNKAIAIPQQKVFKSRKEYSSINRATESFAMILVLMGLIGDFHKQEGDLLVRIIDYKTFGPKFQRLFKESFKVSFQKFLSILRRLESKGIIETYHVDDHKQQRVTLKVKQDTLRKLLYLITWDPNIEEFVIFNFVHIKKGKWPENIIEQRKSYYEKSYGRFIMNLFICFMLNEMLDDDIIQLWIEKTLDYLHKDLEMNSPKFNFESAIESYIDAIVHKDYKRAAISLRPNRYLDPQLDDSFLERVYWKTLFDSLDHILKLIGQAFKATIGYS